MAVVTAVVLDVGIGLVGAPYVFRRHPAASGLISTGLLVLPICAWLIWGGARWQPEGPPWKSGRRRSVGQMLLGLGGLGALAALMIANGHRLDAAATGFAITLLYTGCLFVAAGIGVLSRHDSIEELLAWALRSQDDECQPGSSARNAALQELIDTPSEEVFTAAAGLIPSRDRRKRLLGVRILSELGRPSMPYAHRAAPLLLRCLAVEEDTELLEWEISALGNQRSPEALPALLNLRAHPAAPVRDAVAGAISASQAANLDAPSIRALTELAGDSDAEVRFSAVFELAVWFEAGSEELRVVAALHRATCDADPRVARAAASALASRPSGPAAE